jgi:hypothetical protein
VRGEKRQAQRLLRNDAERAPIAHVRLVPHTSALTNIAEKIMKRSYPILLAAAAALSLGVAAPAFADHRDHGHGHWKHHHKHWVEERHGRHYYVERYVERPRVHIHEHYYVEPAPVYYYPVPRRPQVVVSVPPIVVDF